MVFEVSRGRIRVATFRCPEFALVLFKSMFVEPLASFVLLFVRLVFKTRRVDRFSTFSASPRRANNEKKSTCDFFSFFEFWSSPEMARVGLDIWRRGVQRLVVELLFLRCPEVGLEFCVFTIFVFPTKFPRL